MPPMSTRNDADENTITESLTTVEEEDFLSKIRVATSTQTPLDLTGYQVTLTQGAIRLKGREQLEILGGTIQGAVHSLFQLDGAKVNNPRRLTLRNTKLVHTKVDEDRRQIGAAVFAMGTSVVVLDNCDISSKGGFAIWAKHRCHVTLDHCRIQNIERTAVACFNNVSVTVLNTSISHVGIHGVCGRGQVDMKLRNVTLDDCHIRAIMIYQGASILMEDCDINNTHDPTTPTIHAQGALEESPEKELDEVSSAEIQGQTKKDHNHKEEVKNSQAIKGGQQPPPEQVIPSLTMIRCRVTNSAGPPLVIEGNVHQDLQDNKII